MSDLREDLLNAQVGVLGSLLIDPEKAAGLIFAGVTASDFQTPDYRLIFEAARGIFTSGSQLDAVTVNAALGGSSAKLLMEIMDCTPTAAHVGAYIDLLRRSASLSRLRSIGMTLTGAEDLDACQTALSEAQLLLAERPGVKSSTMAEALQRFYDRHDPSYKPVYLRWGMDKLNSAIHAFPGSMTVIGGYSSDGKTSLATRFAMTMAQDHRVGFFSFEMSRDELTDRILAMTARIGLPDMQANTITEEAWDGVAALSPRLTSSKLEIIEASGMTVAQIRARALAKRYEVVVIDYLQKIAPEKQTRWQSSYETVTQISSDLQQLGRQTGISVIALSQLSRPEKTKGQSPPPTMSSLRQSGQIEQDADVVMLLYREEPDAPDSRRILKIAKNRNGEANVGLFLDFDGPTQIFRVSDNQEPKKKPKKSTAPTLPGSSFEPTEEPIPQDVLDGWDEH